MSGLIYSDKVYTCLSNDFYATNYIGITKSTTGISGTAEIQSSGVVTGLSGLKSGRDYFLGQSGELVEYLDDALEYYAFKVGKALSSTELLLQQPSFSHMDSLNLATLNDDYTWISLPFLANKISFYSDTGNKLSISEATQFNKNILRMTTVEDLVHDCVVFDNGTKKITIVKWTSEGVLLYDPDNLRGTIYFTAIG